MGAVLPSPSRDPILCRAGGDEEDGGGQAATPVLHCQGPSEAPRIVGAPYRGWRPSAPGALRDT